MRKILIFLSFALLMPLYVFSAEFKTADQVSVAQGDAINDDLYIGGGSISMAGNVVGDLLVGGGNILINGPVSGDVVAAGGTINILSDIGDDVRIAGGNILIQGKIKGDLFIGGGQVQVSGNGIDGDVLIAGGIVRLETPVSGDVRIAGGEVYINAPVSGNININADKITFGSRAIVSGNFQYKSPSAAIMESGSSVAGKVDFQKKEIKGKKFLAGIGIIAALIKFLMILLGALLVGFAFPKYVNKFVSSAYVNPWKNIGIGFLSLIVIPIIAVVLMVSIVAIPIGILTAIGYVAIIIWSVFLAPVLLGSLLRRWYKKDEIYEISLKTIIAGVIAISAISIVPILGGIIKFGLFLFAFGSSVITKWGIVKDYR